MNQFTQAEIEKIERVTGHSIFSDVVREQLSSEYTETVILASKSILTSLDTIDAAISDALNYSYVNSNRHTTLNYAAHIRHLKLEGSRALYELVHMLKIELVYNKYTQTYSNRAKTQTVSYW